MERKFKFAIGEFYHVFNRGNDKRTIYLEYNDYIRFIALLYLCNSDKPVNIRDNFPKGLSFGRLKDFDEGNSIVAVGAYCLMPNHFHILIKEITENGITKFMNKLGTAYPMYFNRKYDRSGSLFESKFKAEHIDNNEYLRYMFAYIHLNPIKLIYPEWRAQGISDFEKARDYLMSYQYSSYMDYINRDRLEKAILNKSAFPEYFDNFKDFEDFIKEWLNFKNLELANRRQSPKGKPFGNLDFYF